jgi:hypothetical protein
MTAGGIQAIAGAVDDRLADELRQRGEDVEGQSAPAASQQAVDRSVPRTARPVRMIRPARLAFPGSAENPAGLVDAVVLAAAASVLRLEVLG